jgi:chorismate-pyruvate lyase
MPAAHSADSASDKQLLGLFYPANERLGVFAKVSAAALSPLAARLLDHDHHMTVTLEQHHTSPVDVHVLATRTDGNHYSRKIVLTRQSDNQPVMFGLVRMDKTVFADDVRAEIESQRTPLGRVLIENNVLRSVKRMELYRVAVAAELAQQFKLDAGTVCFSRTAMIYCDEAPAIELLEIVTPN